MLQIMASQSALGSARMVRIAVFTLAICLGLGLLSKPRLLRADERVLVIGDSNSTGLGVPASKAWPMRLMRLLRRPVQVYGAPGAAMATPMVALGDSAQCPRRIAGIRGLEWGVLMLGTNDAAAGVPLDNIRTATTRLVTSTPARWVCITPPSRSNEDTYRTPAGDSIEDYRQAIAESCAAAGATVLNGAALVPPHLLQADGVHVSANGHAKIARAVYRVLRAD